MKALIPDRLFVGDQNDCKCKRPQYGERVASLVHACKHPCHIGKAGQLTPADRKYLYCEEAGDLFLNIIDAQSSFFQRPLFEGFLRFARLNWIEGRPLVIHCNRGKSRAPTLALLFMAKCLQILPDDDYDTAWDKFEETYGEYKPSTGLEEWMRANWHSIECKPVHYEGGTSRKKFQHYNPPDTSRITDEEAVALVMGSPIVHFASMVQIEDKRHELITPVPNILQMRINEAYEHCMMNGIPPRLIILKPRQVGCSTFSTHLCYHHARRYNVNGLMMGDEFSRTAKVWQMFTEYSTRDKLPWNSDFKYDTKKASFRYADGTYGEWEQESASDPKAGIAGTRQVILYTEAARYQKTGSRTDLKVITASLNSLAKVPHSLAIMESTADGQSGVFYNTWQNATTVEGMRNGTHGNGWVKVFAAWYEFPEHTLPRLSQYEHYFHKEFSAREKRGISLYEWDESQIAWRRSTIANECGGDESIFDQDFPEDDVSAFLHSGRPRFDDDGITRLEMMAKAGHDLADRGVLDGNGMQVVFSPVKDNAWLWLKEQPIAGCRYIVFIDPASGEQSRGAKNPDAHAAGVLRQAYIDEANQFHPTELVAAIDVPNGCRWDDTLIAERTVMMANYFGGCMICPETGNGLGVLVKLRDFHGNVYQRKKEDSFIPGKVLNVAGFETNSATRDLWVGALADAIREQEKAFNCCYKPAVAEMRTFVVDDRGKAQAAPGKHDDWCSGLGIGLYLIKFAGIYRPVSLKQAIVYGGQKKQSHQFSY